MQGGGFIFRYCVLRDLESLVVRVIFELIANYWLIGKPETFL